MSPRDVVASLTERGSRPIALALLMLMAGLAMPTLYLPGRSYDSIVVFDITQSMNVEDAAIDGESVDRLTFARRAVRAALRDLPCGSRVGWAAFAEYRTLLLLAPIEVCANYGDLLATLDVIDGRMRWGNASEISKGLFWALRVARETDGRPNVLFVTDGHEAPPLRDGPIAVFDDVSRGNVHGWILGVGDDEPRPIPKTDADGKPMGFWRPEDVVQAEGATQGRQGAAGEHLSSLHEAHLQALAAQLGLGYARLQGAQSVRDAMQDARFAQRRAVPTDLRWLPTLLALALLAWRFRSTGRVSADSRTVRSGGSGGSVPPQHEQRPRK
jgi:mxaL protein